LEPAGLPCLCPAGSKIKFFRAEAESGAPSDAAFQSPTAAIFMRFLCFFAASQMRLLV
jgi:hypothetical protein